MKTIDKMDFINMKFFCFVTDNVQRIIRHTNYKKIFLKDTSV